MKELASHLFDLGCHWLGEYSNIASINRIIRPGREVEDYAVSIFNFRSGASGYMSVNYEDRRSRAIKGNLFGLDGQIEFQFSSYDPRDSKVILYDNEGRKEEVPVAIPRDVDEVYPGHLDSFRKEIDHFVRSIRTGAKPLVGCREGAYAIEVIDAAYTSTLTRQVVRLPLETFDVANLRKCFIPFPTEGRAC
jgi:predicted dehydrogenase